MRNRMVTLGLLAVVASGCVPDAAHELADSSAERDASSDRDAGLDASARHDAGLDAAMPTDAPEEIDASSPVDAFSPADAFSPVDAFSPLAPRLISPLSTATVTSRRPTLRWELAAGTDGARVDLCSSRACTTVLETIDVVGTSARPTVDLPTGVVFWRLHGRSGSTTSAATSVTWQFYVGARSAPVDTSWGTTLDVNGDGYADVAVGASRMNTVYVHHGGAVGLGAAPAWTQTLPAPSVGFSGFGQSVASAGDVDGDGYADLIVGAECVGSVCTGAAHLYFGGPTGLGTTAAWVETVPGTASFGSCVASAGDVDGDGYGDVIVGAPRTEPGGNNLSGASSLTNTPSVPTKAGDGRPERPGVRRRWRALLVRRGQSVRRSHREETQ